MAGWRRGKKKEGESGVALLLAVWVLALLAVMATAVTRDAKSSLNLTRNRVEISQARALADAGAWETIAALLDAQRGKTLFLDGRPQILPVSGDRVQIVIQDETGKLDLNLATEESLKALFRLSGIDSPVAASLARNVIAYRTNLETLAARERKPESPPPAPIFLTREEIRLVPGVTLEIYSRVSPFITVYGGNGQINPATAPAPVLAAVSGMTLEAATRAVERRRQTPAEVGSVGLPRLRVMTILSKAAQPSGATFTREAVVDVTPRPERLYQLLAWSAPR